jgi:DNA-binding response OmpR family regulator
MRRIFVVDDEPDVVELLRTILEAEGFEVEATTDGGTALPRILDRPPDLLLLDLMMPDMDGFELLKLLRQDPRGRELRVLILSARTGHQDQVESLQLGANAYVFKPFSPRDLTRQVHALLADDEQVGTGD